jgi:outer membrane murein-binding lipoprotein Lpp
MRHELLIAAVLLAAGCSKSDKTLSSAEMNAAEARQARVAAKADSDVRAAEADAAKASAQTR